MSASAAAAAAAGADSPLEAASIEAEEAARRVVAPEGANFFVWCNECSRVGPGSLRVRCGKCREEACELKGDPQGWDDILPEESSIRVECFMCEMRGQDSDQPANFFFKCWDRDCPSFASKNHNAQPLPMLVRPADEEEAECLFCMGEVNLLVDTGCAAAGGNGCLSCWVQYAAMAVRTMSLEKHPRTGAYSLGCSDPTCANRANSFIEHPAMFKMLGPLYMARFREYAAQQAILDQGGVVCPLPGCMNVPFMPADPAVKDTTCPSCKGSFCRVCQEASSVCACPPGTAPPQGAQAQAAAAAAALARDTDYTRGIPGATGRTLTLMITAVGHGKVLRESIDTAARVGHLKHQLLGSLDNVTDLDHLTLIHCGRTLENHLRIADQHFSASTALQLVARGPTGTAPLTPAQRAAAQHSADAAAGAAAVAASSQSCPKCSKPIQRSSGCHHMTCPPPCRHQFCYVCLKDWGTDCQSQHWFCNKSCPCPK